MIFVPQRSISKSGLGGGACKLLPLQEDFGSFAASCLGGGAGRQQGGETIGVPCRETGRHVWGLRTNESEVVWWARDA